MKRSEKKFIDLIFRASGKWANWDPEMEIQVGSYGIVDGKTGQFQGRGNIYTNQDIKKQLPDLAPPVIGPGVNNEKIVSKNARTVEFNIGPKVEVAGLLDTALVAKWKFDNGEGAFIVMYKPRTTYLSDEVLNQLTTVPILNGMSLVTRISKCPGFAIYLSTSADDEVGLELSGVIPVPSAPGISAGATANLQWRCTNTTGRYVDGFSTEGLYNYTPVFTLRQMADPNARGAFGKFFGKIRMVQRPPPSIEEHTRLDPGSEEIDSQTWPLVQPPWGDLSDEEDETAEAGKAI